MNTQTIRKSYRIGLVVAVVLFLVMLIDHFANDGGLLGLWATLFAVVAVLMVLMLFLKPTEDAEAEPEPEVEADADAYYDFKGDVHPVIDVEGIGPVYAEKLEALGIKTTARLCYEDAEALAQKLDVPAKTVRKWQAMSQLAKVNGIGKQYAEALVRAGVEGIDELKQGEPEPIATKVSTYLDGLGNNVLGQKVTPKRVAGWQKKARTMRRVRQPVPTA